LSKPIIKVSASSTLETPGGEAGLRLLKNFLPALRLFNAMIPTAYAVENDDSRDTKVQ
jgi:hypothetical protein